MTRPTLGQASAWLLAVRSQFDIREEPRDAKLAVRGIAASFVKTYDASALTAESQEAVSATLKWFKEPDIRERLDVWVRVNAPETVEVLHPEAATAPIGETARWHYSHFLKAADEPTAIRALDTLRSREQAAFDWIVRHDHGAAGYAVMRHWDVTPTTDELTTDWDDEAQVRAFAGRLRTMGYDTVWASRIREQAIASFLMTVGLHAHHLLDVAVNELRSTAPVEVAFVEPVTLFGEIL